MQTKKALNSFYVSGQAPKGASQLLVLSLKHLCDFLSESMVRKAEMAACSMTKHC